MPEQSVFILTGLCAIGLGLWQLLTPLDNLWQWQERRMLARGLAPQRNPLWESNMRIGAWVCIAVGVAMLIIPLASSSSIVTPPKMSGAGIDGHEFTQAEWDNCGHDFNVCASRMK